MMKNWKSKNKMTEGIEGEKNKALKKKYITRKENVRKKKRKNNLEQKYGTSFILRRNSRFKRDKEPN